MQRLIRIAISIRSQPSHVRAQCASWEGFYSFRQSQILSESAGAIPLFREIIAPAAVRSLAKTAAHLQDFSTAFFATRLESFNQLRPCRRELDLRGCLPDGETVPIDSAIYNVRDILEPSWIEEQRVVRALWRIVIYLDVRKATSGGEESQARPDTCNDGRNSVWCGLSGHESRELRCIYDFLRGTDYGAISSTSGSAPLQSLPAIERENFSVPKQIPLPNAMAQYWWQLPDQLHRPSPGFQCFCTYPEGVCHRGRFVIDRRGGETFVNLGLDIWDGEKLTRLGLVVLNTRQGMIRTRLGLCKGGSEHVHRLLKYMDQVVYRSNPRV